MFDLTHLTGGDIVLIVIVLGSAIVGIIHAVKGDD